MEHMLPDAPDKLAVAIWEAARHVSALRDALADWHMNPPASLEQVESDPESRRLADQLLFRFLKLQDTLGERLVPATLAHLLEPDADRPMVDKLNRLERLGFIRLDDWLQWRDLRNRLSHEYPEQADLRWATLLAAVDAAAAMVALYERWHGRLAK
ncbi:MAG: hypothetical protein RLZZ180_2287 [Pseudomonadota bacterium]|jgi:hypothetical protein